MILGKENHLLTSTRDVFIGALSGAVARRRTLQKNPKQDHWLQDKAISLIRRKSN